MNNEILPDPNLFFEYDTMREIFSKLWINADKIKRHDFWNWFISTEFYTFAKEKIRSYLKQSLNRKNISETEKERIINDLAFDETNIDVRNCTITINVRVDDVDLCEDYHFTQADLYYSIARLKSMNITEAKWEIWSFFSARNDTRDSESEYYFVVKYRFKRLGILDFNKHMERFIIKPDDVSSNFLKLFKKDFKDFVELYDPLFLDSKKKISEYEDLVLTS